MSQDIENNENIEVENTENVEIDNTKMSDARRAVLVDNLQEDLVNAGFEKLDSHLVDLKPPRIRFGELYKQFTDAEKIEYLEKIASVMNNAASLVQGERDELGKLCEMKEKQLNQITHDLRANNSMIQGEVMKLNEERQSFNKHVAELNKKIKELEKELKENKSGATNHLKNESINKDGG
jgi:hypothetical protein